MRFKSLIITSLFLLLIICIYANSKSCNNKVVHAIKNAIIKPSAIDFKTIINKAIESKSFIKNNEMNADLMIFVDFSLQSNQKRMFLIDLLNDSIISSGLVTHGHCGNYANSKIKFSNVVGSNCSSLGKYKIGYKYKGTFGTAYKLYGLDSSNSNAFKRFVVLHAHSCVPNNNARILCESEGCPTVSFDYLKSLETYLDNSEKPILLYIKN